MELERCTCEHAEADGGTANTSATGTGRVADPTLVALLAEMARNNQQLTRAFVAQQERPAAHAKSMLKTTQTLEFPKGSETALENLEGWLKEFDRVVQHVSAGAGLLPQDRITHLLAARPVSTDVGENMRLDQQTEEYRRREGNGEYEWCWEFLLATLRRYAISPATARRKAQLLWSSLAWPTDGTLRSFHTLLRRALLACERNRVAKADHEVVLRYLEFIPAECALHLEDPIRAPADGWTLAPLMRAAEDYYELRQAYPSMGDGGLGRSGRGNRQNAVWANDLKMMQTPLNPPAPSGGNGGIGQKGSCRKCQGHGHHSAECPNTRASSDSKWAQLSDAASENPARCAKGWGIGSICTESVRML